MPSGATEERENEMPNLEDYVREHNITVEVVKDRGTQVEDKWEHHAYIVRLTDHQRGSSIETPWKQGLGIETSPTDTPETILDSLVSDAWTYYTTGDFEEWTSELGMNPDSRKDYQVWETVRDLYPQVVNFVGDLEMVATEYERL